MQLGFVSAILPDLDLPSVLQQAARLDYECVEVMCWPRGKAERRYAGITHLDVESLDARTVDQVRAWQAETGVRLSGLGYYPNLLAPEEDEAARSRAHLERVIDAASRLGLERVNTFLGRDWTRSVADNWSRMLDTWGPLIERAAAGKVRIGIENCPMLFSADEWPGGKNLPVSPALWRRLFADLPSPWLGLNYDPSHLVWQQIDYVRPLAEFAGRIFHVHAKDARLDRARLNEVGILAHPLEYHTPKLPGLGDVDWGRFFAALSETGYAGPVCVEVEDRAYEGSLAARLAALRQSATYLRNFVPRREPA
jgi:sugar phosphate isomerase/epimerase